MLTTALLILAAVGVVSGIIAGLGGPGGIPVIATLYLVKDLSPATMAGTTSTIFTAATIVATWLYTRTGNVSWRTAAVLVPTTLVGTQLGVALNASLSSAMFGVLLGVLMLFTGTTIVYREARELQPLLEIDSTSVQGIGILAGLGLFVGVAGGTVGIGGPAITIPALIVLGLPALTAIGTGLVQGIFVSASTAAGYLAQGSPDLALVAVIGGPYVVAQVAGWKLAHDMEARRLKMVLGGMLVLLAVYFLATSI